MLQLNTFFDYLALCKLRVVSLITFSAVIGMVLACPHALPWGTISMSLLGITLAASAGAVINHVFDVLEDQKMARTKDRPLAQGKIRPQQALLLALALITASMSLLILFANPLTALLTLLTMVGYAVIYTVYLKPLTPQNIVIGGLSGAMPPLLGWTSITNQINIAPWLIVLIIFVWTPAHFWALAIYRRHEYQLTRMPVLPVTHGVALTQSHIVLYALLTVCASYLPYTFGLCHAHYLVGVSILNGYWLLHAWRLFTSHAAIQAMRFFKCSIIYLTLLFLTMLIDHAV